MSILFTPKKLGNVVIKNRFVHSACEDNMATENGLVTDGIVDRLQQLSMGEVGLIIWSHLAVHPSGRTNRYQAGIYEDEMIPGLRGAVRRVHDEGGKIAFQLGHGGIKSSKAVTGQPTIGPASMTGKQIREIISAFKESAERTIECGADAVQLHAAHGYLLNEFLSPYFNRRHDEWGGTAENRFRILKEVISESYKVLPAGFPLLVKLNANDHAGKEGITPSLAVEYAERLKGLAIDGLEISCGGVLMTSGFMHMCRGEVPVEEIAQGFPKTQQEQIRANLKQISGRFDLKEPYNLDAAKLIRPVFGDIPLFVVGGWRDLAQMERAVSGGYTDFVSMCRPFIRQPDIVKRFKDGKAEKASCKNCNKCLAALANNIEVRCYFGGFPHNDSRL